MTLHIKLINTMIVVLLLSIIQETYSEYYLKGDFQQPLSYLEYNVTDTFLNIFPNNLEVKFFMWQTIGTLIYSIDKNGNQFMLEVIDFPGEDQIQKPNLYIKIRGDKVSFPFKKLCSCKQYCKDENVTLLVNIKETNLSISCNGNNEYYIGIQNDKDVYPDLPRFPYPISSHNQAVLWALNVPDKYGGKHDPYRIGCCLFYVKSNNKVINMTAYGSGIKNKCPRSCNLYPCKSGEICIEKYTETTHKYCYYATTTAAAQNPVTYENSNLKILIPIVVILALIIITFIICICCTRRLNKCCYRKQKKAFLHRMEKVEDYLIENNNPKKFPLDSPILIGFGINDSRVKDVNESINTYLTKYNLSCNTINADVLEDRDIMDDIMQCKVVVVVYNVKESNIEAIYQLVKWCCKQLILIVISTDKFIRNENMRELLQNHDNLMYFDNVWNIIRGASQIANKIKHNLKKYTLIEVAYPKTYHKVIYVVNFNLNNIFNKVLSAFQKYNYEVIVSSNTENNQFDRLDNINKAHVLIFCYYGDDSLCLHHKLVYRYCMDKKLVIPVVINYVPEMIPKWADTLLHNNHGIFIDDSDTATQNADKLAGDIWNIIQNYVLIIDCGFGKNELSAIKGCLLQKQVKCRTQYECYNYEKEIIKYINSSNVIVMPIKLDGISSSVDNDIFTLLYCIAKVVGKYVVPLLLGQETGGKYYDNLKEYLKDNKNVFKFTNIDQLKKSENKIAEFINKLNGNINNEVKYKMDHNSNIIYLVNCTNSRKLNKFVEMLTNKDYSVIEDDHSGNKNFIELTKSITSALSVIFVMENNDTDCPYHRMLYNCCRGLGALILPVLINYTADTLPDWMCDMWDSPWCQKYDKEKLNISQIGVIPKVFHRNVIRFSPKSNFISVNK